MNTKCVQPLIIVYSSWQVEHALSLSNLLLLSFPFTHHPGVDPGILTFSNHGCNGSYNVGTRLNFTEQNDPDPELLASSVNDGLDFYDPVTIRHFPMWECGGTAIALRDIEKGEEVLDNYLLFEGTSYDALEQYLAVLRQWCSGESTGPVTEYEGDIS